MKTDQLQLTVSELIQRVKRLERQKSPLRFRAGLSMLFVGASLMVGYAINAAADPNGERATESQIKAAYVELGDDPNDTEFEADVVRARRFEVVDEQGVPHAILGKVEVSRPSGRGMMTDAGVFLVRDSRVEAQFTIPVGTRVGTTTVPPAAE